MADKIAHLEKITERIYDLQTSYVSLQEQHQKSHQHFERHLDESALQLIDILDLMEYTLSSASTHTDESVLLKKIEKKLRHILRSMKIQEILFKENRIEPGKIRVLETKKDRPDLPPNTIIEICRKGYQRGDKVIRPADVITTSCN